MYGWESHNSDVDWRGVYLTGTENIIGLWHKRDHFTEVSPHDIVVHELAKEISLLLKGNCNALERIYSNPFFKDPDFYALKALVDRSLNKTGPWASYRGLAVENYNKFIKGGKASTYKKWLYIVRALRAGIHYLNHNQIEPNIHLIPNNATYKEIDYLIDRKMKGSEEEDAYLPNGMQDRLDIIVLDLMDKIDIAYENSNLPHVCPDNVREDAHKWLIEMRKRKIGK